MAWPIHVAVNSERFVGEDERAPVHAQRLAGVQVLVDAHRLLGIDMLWRHEPAGLVRTDRQNRYIKRSAATGDDPKLGMERGIAGEKHGMLCRTQRPPAPKSGVALAKCSSGEMLGRNTGQTQ